MQTHSNFEVAIRAVGESLRSRSFEVRGTNWQSTDVSTKPEMRMREILNVSFQVPLAWGSHDLDRYREDIKPNLPWADDHFEERVSGQPLNPGVQWANWPWALSADRFRTEGGGLFSHTYMERYWPKEAGAHYRTAELSQRYRRPNYGIRYQYGDLNDVVEHLAKDPLSRQAYLPVWFPEDTGVVHGERVPCTLGYHFIQRQGYFHSTYYIRSCDFVRHFRDDLYLSLRLQLWILDQLRGIQEGLEIQAGHAFDFRWTDVRPGLFVFHCVSMHCFVNDWNKLFGERR